ncbi:MAG: hypothetical protein QXF76_00420 [Candidatus Anstonellales archaeon]
MGKCQKKDKKTQQNIIKKKYDYIESIEELNYYPYIIVNGKKLIVIDIIK